MTQTLRFIVENSALVTVQVQTTFDGNPATVSYDRAHVEALPADGVGPTFTMLLDPAALPDFPEGSVIAVTVAVESVPEVAAEPGQRTEPAS